MRERTRGWRLEGVEKRRERGEMRGEEIVEKEKRIHREEKEDRSLKV